MTKSELIARIAVCAATRFTARSGAIAVSRVSKNPIFYSPYRSRGTKCPIRFRPFLC